MVDVGTKVTAVAADPPAAAGARVPVGPDGTGLEGTIHQLRKKRDLEFEPQRPVKWLDPRVLAMTGLRLMLSSVFERFADKRENEAGIEAPLIDVTGTGTDDLWVDYVSDVGDGFDATATIAWLVAQPTLTIDGVELPRASVLVMGGDEVYPFASIEAYDDHTFGPYRTMFPHSESPSPVVLAIPGNHDWYDGLTSFLHVFAQKRPDQTPPATVAKGATTGRWIGGWVTAQRRSYFVAQLPGQWWLWGIDIQLDTYIDNPQMEYFSDAAKQLQPGDGVILCCARPSWLHCGKSSPEEFAVLDFFERTIIRPTGAHLRVTLTGDHHSYGRYESRDGEQKYIVGGGAAYLDATHHFPDDIVLPPDESRDRLKSPAKPFRLVRDSLYPTVKQSKRAALKVGRILWRNGVWFPVMTALFYGLWAAALRDDRVLSSIGFWASTAVALLVLVGLTHEERFLPKLAAVPHAALHLGAVYALSRLFVDLSWTALYVGAAGAVVGPLLLAVYLWVADHWAINSSELFAGMRVEKYKCFLRIRVSAAGELTIYSIGIDSSFTRWRLLPDEKDKPPLAPVGAANVTKRFIDGPVVVSRTPTGPSTEKESAP